MALGRTDESKETNVNKTLGEQLANPPGWGRGAENQ